MHEWLCKGLIFPLVTLTVFPWLREGGKRRGNFMPIIPHFIDGPFQGLDAASLAMSMGVN